MAIVFASQPFRNQLVTMTLTGKQIKDVLEQQWPIRSGRGSCRSRKASATPGTTASRTASASSPTRMSLNGAPIDPAARYRVTVNNYLAVGGDGFVALTQGTAPLTGIYDVDALYAYFQANSPIAPGAADRIVRIN